MAARPAHAWLGLSLWLWACARTGAHRGRGLMFEDTPPRFRKLCPLPAFANYSSPVQTDDLPSNEPTAVFWVINPHPNARFWIMLASSVYSVYSQRAPGETLHLIILVYPRSSRTGGVSCDRLLHGNKIGPSLGTLMEGVRCRDVTVRTTRRGCTAAVRPMRRSAEITIATAAGEWNHHPVLSALASARRTFFENYKLARNLPNPREDLVEHAEQTFLRYVAYGLLLLLGVRRAVYLDVDVTAKASLRPLHRTRLSWPITVGVVARCANDVDGSQFNRNDPVVRAMGFRDPYTQVFNSGVLVLDLQGLCLHRGDLQLLRVANRSIHAEKSLWNAKAGSYDQPVAIIGWASNVTMLDPRWNCRKPVEAFKYCRIVHEKHVGVAHLKKVLGGNISAYREDGGGRRGGLRDWSAAGGAVLIFSAILWVALPWRKWGHARARLGAPLP